MGAMPGIYLVNVWSKVSGARGAERNIGKIRVEVRPVTKCLDLDRYEFDLYRYQYSENTGNEVLAKSFDTANLINRCYGQNVKVEGKVSDAGKWNAVLGSFVRDGIAVTGISTFTQFAMNGFSELGGIFKWGKKGLEARQSWCDLQHSSDSNTVAQAKAYILKNGVKCEEVPNTAENDTRDLSKQLEDLDKTKSADLCTTDTYTAINAKLKVIDDKIEKLPAIQSVKKEELKTTLTNVKSKLTAQQLDCPKPLISSDVDASSEDVDAPSEGADAPSLDADAPSLDADVPSEDTDVPSEDTDVPSEDVDAPAEDADVPSEDADVPSEDEALQSVFAPTASPVANTYTTTQNVVLTSTTSGATIRYTIDGSTPSSTVGTVYSGPISVATTKTIKAIAYKSGMTNSSVSSFNYTLQAAPEPTLYPMILQSQGTACSVAGITVNNWACVCTRFSGVTFVVAARCTQNSGLVLYSSSQQNLVPTSPTNYQTCYTESTSKCQN